MKATPDRDLLVLFKNRFMAHGAMEREVEHLNTILRRTELPDEFCKSHELVCRNKITQKQSKILATLGRGPLKPFWFFISRN